MALSAKDLQRVVVAGAPLLVLQDKSFPLVQLTVALRGGALADPPEARGALSALFTLLLRGTRTKSRAAYQAALAELGATVDVAVGHEMAVLTATTLTEHFAATVALVAEALTAPALAEQELVALREETLEELLAERDDDDAVADIFLRRAYYGGQAGTPAGHRMAESAGGNVASVRQLTREALLAAHARLRSADLVVGVAGDLDRAAAEQALAPLLEQLAKNGPAQPTAALWPEPAALPQARILVVDKPERTQVQMRVAQRGLHARHPDSLAFWLGIMAFGGTFTSPLTREVRDTRGWSYFAHASYRRRSFLTAPVVLRTAPALADAVPCLALQVSLLKDTLAAGKLGHQDVARARDYLVGRLPFQSATAFDVLGQAMSLEIMRQPLDELWDMAARLDALAPENIPQVVQAHLAGAPYAAVLVGPQAALLPQLEQTFAAERARNALTIEVLPYTEDLLDLAPDAPLPAEHDHAN